jgi:hypothetical protein
MAEAARALIGALSLGGFVRHELAAALPMLDQWQEDAAGVRVPGTLLLCGRQTGKSTFAAALTLQRAITRQNQLVLLISPTLRQSSELFRKTMVLFDALRVPVEPERRTQTEIKLPNGSSIHSLPGANADAIRGFSAPDLIVEDESAFVNDQTFIASRPMLATNPGGRHILLTTPFGQRGHFYDLWSRQDPAWARLMIRSEDCPRIARAFLDGERRTLSDRAYRQEYECEFLESASAVFPADWVERLVDDDARHGELMPDEVLVGESLAVVDPGPWASIGAR